MTTAYERRMKRLRKAFPGIWEKVQREFEEELERERCEEEQRLLELDRADNELGA